MDDLINRQQAIDAIDAIFPVDPMKTEYAQGIACGAALAKTYIEQLPSAQPDYEKIITEIKQCITETREHGKHHAKFVQDNGELYISGLEMALSIIEENR